MNLDITHITREVFANMTMEDGDRTRTLRKLSSNIQMLSVCNHSNLK